MLSEGREIKSQINRRRQVPSNHFKNSVRQNTRASAHTAEGQRARVPSPDWLPLPVVLATWHTLVQGRATNRVYAHASPFPSVRIHGQNAGFESTLLHVLLLFEQNSSYVTSAFLGSGQCGTVRRKETGKNRRLPHHPIVSSSFILLPLGFGGLEPLIVLCFGDALFNEPFTIASPFVILILAGSHWHFVTCRAMHRIPAFGFGR